MLPLAFRVSVGALLLHTAAAHVAGDRRRLLSLASQNPPPRPSESHAPAAEAELSERRGLQEQALDLAVEKSAERKQKDDVPSLRDALPSILMASLAGLTTTLGAFIIFLMPQGPPPWAMAFTLSLAAGVMVTVASELVWGKSRHSFWPWFLFVCGAALTWLLTYLATSLQRQTESDLEGDDSQPKHRSMWRLAMVLFVSLTLHNFPEGMAVAVSALQSSQLGLTICIGIACHNIPEGITIAVTTYEATKSRSQALLMTFLSGVAEPIGAISAVLVFRRFLSSQVVECLVAAVAGVMLYISVAELLPESLATKRWLCVAAGFVSGVVVIVITSVIIDRFE